jgi:hypothetical protein
VQTIISYTDTFRLFFCRRCQHWQENHFQARLRGSDTELTLFALLTCTYLPNFSAFSKQQGLSGPLFFKVKNQAFEKHRCEGIKILFLGDLYLHISSLLNKSLVVHLPICKLNTFDTAYCSLSLMPWFAIHGFEPTIFHSRDGCDGHTLQVAMWQCGLEFNWTRI